MYFVTKFMFICWNFHEYFCTNEFISSREGIIDSNKCGKNSVEVSRYVNYEN